MTHDKLNYLDKLHNNGYRLTRQRQVILDAVCQADGHATIGEIYYRSKALDKGIDRSTIYRTLDVFVELGLVISADNVNGDRVYEVIKECQHHHLLCKKCGDDIEIENEVVNDFYQHLRAEYGYQVEMDHLVVIGVCSNCA